MFPLQSSTDLTPLLDDLSNRKVVMLGEASHGTHEYYTWRAAISKRLIQEKGFRFIAVEGDWPDCYLINRYVKGYPDAGDDIYSILKRFDRWPTWMWSNWEIAALAGWLRNYNSSRPANEKVGFYGLDVYSLWDSMRVMIDYLDKEDPAGAKSVRQAISCFEPFNEDEQSYARFTLHDHGCRDQVMNMLRNIQTRAQFLDGDREAGFNTEQNALVAVNAENYYRSMIGFDNESWNIRDRHMIETLDRLIDFHHGARAIVWEHNTHIGDARATNMPNAGMVNTGQLAREYYGDDQVYLVGFSSWAGSVIAGRHWGAPMKVVTMPPARSGSIEEVLHHYKPGNYYFLFSQDLPEFFRHRIDHRAIGVVHDPAREKYGNYVLSDLRQRYDALVFLNETNALHPIQLHPDKHKLPATYPFAL